MHEDNSNYICCYYLIKVILSICDYVYYLDEYLCNITTNIVFSPIIKAISKHR